MVRSWCPFIGFLIWCCIADLCCSLVLAACCYHIYERLGLNLYEYLENDDWKIHDLYYRHNGHNILTYALQNVLPAAVLYGSVHAVVMLVIIFLEIMTDCTEFPIQTSKKLSEAFNMINLWLCCGLSLLLQGCCSAVSPISWELWWIETWFVFEIYSWC